METKIIRGHGEPIAQVLSNEKLIVDSQSALDLIASVNYLTECTRVLLPKEVIAEDFFVLSTGLAGEVLQKFVTYQTKIAIVGDYSRYTSKPLRDFIYESNNGANVCFASTEAEALAWFERA